MHKFALVASLAVNAAASPISLPDPAQVAADWKRTFEEACQPMLTPGPLGLTAFGPGSLTFHAPAAPVFDARPTPAPSRAADGPAADVPSSSTVNNHEVMVAPGDMDPKILHQVSGDMDPKILHSRGDKPPRVLKPFKPIDPRLQPPATPVVPEDK